MQQRGFTHNNKPSIRSLARAAGVTVNAVSRVIFRSNYGEDTAVKVGEAIGDPEFVADWISVDLGSEYQPPVAARKLTARQRLLVDDLIRELTGGQKDAGNAEAQKTPGEVVDFAQARQERAILDSLPVSTAADTGEDSDKGSNDDDTTDGH